LLYLDWEEAEQAETGAKSLRARLSYRLCAYGGLRAHEVADARIEHVNPARKVIYVPHGHLGPARYAALDTETLQLLAIYVGSRKKGPLLAKADGSPITRYIVYYDISRAGFRSGVDKGRPVGPRMLRHTHATTWLRRKGNIRLLQKQMGHTRLDSTAYYLDWLPEEVQAEHARLFEQTAEETIIEPVGSILRALLPEL